MYANTLPFGRRIKHYLVTAVLAMAMIVGLNLATATPAQAVEGQCGWPRCTIYLNKEETRYLAYDANIPPSVWAGPYGGLAWALVMGHRFFLIQYANQGKCVAFNFSGDPRESQGLLAYSC